MPRQALLPASPSLVTRLRLRLDLLKVETRIDRTALGAIRERYRHGPASAYESKYWSLGLQLPKNLRRAYRLGLHRPGPKLDVLDLGTGFGYFPFVCEFYGHRALGLDQDDWAGENLYRDVVDLLGVERVLSPIRPFRPLPDLGRRFDLVTAFACLFNRPKKRDAWSVGEWQYFVDSLSELHLAPGGSLLLTLNRGHDGEILDAPSRRWFLDNGAYLEGTTIYLQGAAVPARNRHDELTRDSEDGGRR